MQLIGKNLQIVNRYTKTTCFMQKDSSIIQRELTMEDLFH